MTEQDAMHKRISEVIEGQEVVLFMGYFLVQKNT